MHETVQRAVASLAARPAGSVAVRFVARILKLAAYCVAGFTVAVALLRAVATDDGDLPGWWRLLGLTAVAIVGYAAGFGLGVAADELGARHLARREHATPRLSAADRERERLRELPRLARESGPALQELRQEEKGPGTGWNL